jgi:hypothetical protein
MMNQVMQSDTLLQPLPFLYLPSKTNEQRHLISAIIMPAMPT